MVFDKIKNAITGAKDGEDLGEVAKDLGAGAYSKYLDGITYPVSKDELLGALQNNGAPDSLVTHVESLSKGSFNSPDEILATLKAQF